LAKADSGELTLFGKGLNDDIQSARHRIGVVIENPTLHKGLDAYDNLEIHRRLLKTVDKNRIAEVLKLVGLDAVGKKKTSQFSLGMKQRLSLAIALLNKPDFLILDEPINGLDPMGVVEMRNLIKDLASSGVTIMISSHILSELHLLATDFGIIEGGKLVAQLTAEELDAVSLHHTVLNTTDNEKAFSSLAKQYGEKIKKTDAHLEITDINILPEDIVKQLVTQNIGIKAIYQVDQDLESYFVDLVSKQGGHQYV